jgi:AcrR family transcriptional regulator
MIPTYHTSVLDALLRIAGTKGLHAATMRSVAAEAGVSVATVQYYFHTKEELLFAGLEHAAQQVGKRAMAAFQAAEGLEPRDRLEAWLTQLLPADDEQRRLYTVFAAYHALALTDEKLRASPYSQWSSQLERVVEGMLSTEDSAVDAANVVAMASGLGDSVMAGMRDFPEAVRHLRHQLNRLFSTS